MNIHAVRGVARRFKDGGCKWPRHVHAMALFCLLFQAPGAVAKEYVIGVIVGLTGAGASYAGSIVQGAEMAVQEVNAAGGVNGHKLRLRVVDDSSDPARSAIAMRKLVNTSPDVIVGGWGSPQVLAHLDLAEQSGIPYIVTSATNARIITASDRWVFRVIQSDDAMASELARLAGKLGMKRIAILHDRNVYGTGSRDIFTDTLKQLGKIPVESQSYEAADRDFSIQLGKIRAANPDALVIFGTVPAAPAIMKQARALGINARFMGSGGFASELLIKDAGKAAEGTLLMSTYHPEVDENVSAWSKRHFRLHRKGATLYPAGAVKEYAAIHDVVAPCMRQADADRPALRDCIAGWRGKFTGVAGTTHFEPSGQLDAPPIPVEIRQGKFRLMKAVQ